jgi:hypothetical protein
MAHPAFLEVPASRWEWLVEQYEQIVVDSTISTRIFHYHKILLIWWLARFTRYLYEIPRGFDQRLSPSLLTILNIFSWHSPCFYKSINRGWTQIVIIG